MTLAALSLLGFLGGWDTVARFTSRQTKPDNPPPSPVYRQAPVVPTPWPTIAPLPTLPPVTPLASDLGLPIGSDLPLMAGVPQLAPLPTLAPLPPLPAPPPLPAMPVIAAGGGNHSGGS